MAKHALSLIAKIVLFTIVMLLVARWVPYDSMVNTFIFHNISVTAASTFGEWIIGEPSPEPYALLNDGISILINTLISVPLVGLVITVLLIPTRRENIVTHLKEWANATVRRFIKLFTFTLLFWVFFRFLPYQTFFPANQSYSGFTLITITGFNLLLTIICYGYIAKRFTTKRSL